jgi:hypothetical protein
MKQEREMSPYPLLVEALDGAAGDDNVLVRVDGHVAGALPAQLVSQALHNHHTILIQTSLASSFSMKICRSKPR